MTESSKLEWHVNVPIEDFDWKVGLIVGPSGCGKTTLAKHMFKDAVDSPLNWGEASVVDDFSSDYDMKSISAACNAVGFNTIPAWLRPFHVLSNGEQFRVSLARRLLEGNDLVVVDEFTSVVDRQVAKIGSHAVQKWVRRDESKQFVGVTCHYDVIDWLQPDWVLDPSTGEFARRSVQRRPPIRCVVSPVPYAIWSVFKRFHYLDSSMNKAARCFALWVDFGDGGGLKLASFTSLLVRPHPSARVMGYPRVVTLPDFQGMGFAFVLFETVAKIYSALGWRVHCYPAHPPFIRAIDKSPLWKMTKRPGTIVNLPKKTSVSKLNNFETGFGGRPCATFEWIGPKMDLDEAKRITSYFKESKL